MYWTRIGPGVIEKAGMDGSRPVTVVAGLAGPCSITIDFHGSRLFWAEYLNNLIQSSGLDGRDVVTKAQVSNSPFGITISRQRIYWSLFSSNVMTSSTTTGGDIRTEHNGTSYIRHLMASDWNLPGNRINPCEKQTCSGICVLALTSFRCL